MIQSFFDNIYSFHAFSGGIKLEGSQIRIKLPRKRCDYANSLIKRIGRADAAGKVSER